MFTERPCINDSGESEVFLSICAHSPVGDEVISLPVYAIRFTRESDPITIHLTAEGFLPDVRPPVQSDHNRNDEYCFHNDSVPAPTWGGR